MLGCITRTCFVVCLLVAIGEPVASCDACQKSKNYVAASTATLIEGLDGWSHPVTTSSREAQCFFDQGLVLCFGFNHYEAIRFFNRALTLDSQMAMAHWGIAYALGGNYNIPIDRDRMLEAVRHIERAKQLSLGVTPREQAYIGALALRYSPDSSANWASLDSQYARGMNQLAKSYPDDPDAAVLSAEATMNLRPWRLWDHAGTPAEGTESILDDLSGVLKRYPNHPGAAHFYIHAIEASPQPERGLMAALALEQASPPASGHLVHMPSHIYIRTGRYRESVEANQRAVAADSAYLESTFRGGLYELIYYSHNQHFIAVSASLLGDSGVSLKAARSVDALLSPLVVVNPMAEALTGTVPLIMARFQQWQEILAAPLPDTSLRISSLLWRYARTLAHLRNGRRGAAVAEQTAFEHLRRDLPESAMIGAMNSARTVSAIAAAVLQAEFARFDNRQEEATGFYRTAVALQDSLSYDEPEGWYIPVREALGAQLLRVKRAAEAIEVFRTDLKHHPRNGRSLFGLMQALSADGQTEAASLVEREYQDAWKDATVTLALETF